MALNPSAAYPAQIDTTDPTGYPYGKAKNVTAIGDGLGTPLERLWLSDLFGFEQALLASAGLTPSGTPDKVGASQYLTALTALGDARSKLAVQTARVLNWPERASFTDATAVNSDFMLAWAPYNTLGPGTGPLYVAACLGTKHVATSPDGSRWSVGSTLANLSTSGGNIAYGLIAGVPNFVATADSFNHLYSSPDGLGWTLQATSGGILNSVQYAYSASLNRWVAASDAPYYAAGSNILSWTGATAPGTWASNSGGCKRVVWNGTTFVALPVNSYNKCLTSSDGITWTEQTLPFTAVWSGLAYSADDQLWMAVASNTGPVATSPNGISWTSAAATNYGVVNDLAVLGNIWVGPTVIGNFGGIVWSGDKGATWNRLAVGNHDVATAGWKRIIAADNRFVVAHQTGSVLELALSQRAL